MTSLSRSAAIIWARPSGLRASMLLRAHLGDDQVICARGNDTRLRPEYRLEHAVRAPRLEAA